MGAPMRLCQRSTNCWYLSSFELKRKPNDLKIAFKMGLLLASYCICKLQFCIELDINFTFHIVIAISDSWNPVFKANRFTN